MHKDITMRSAGETACHPLDAGLEEQAVHPEQPVGAPQEEEEAGQHCGVGSWEARGDQGARPKGPRGQARAIIRGQARAIIKGHPLQGH